LLTIPELDRLRIVLVGTRNPLNLGAAARAMSNFGVLHLRVVKPYEPSFREARSAVGPAAEVLSKAVQFESLSDAIADCVLVVGTTAIQHRELQHPAHPPEEAVGMIRQQLVAANAAIVFGGEKTGLSNEDLSHCHRLMHIPTRAEHLSMNLGQAVAVTLYELVRESLALVPVERDDPATAGDLERITKTLLQALEISGYTTTATLVVTEEKARRLIRRMGLKARDAEVLLGMLRQIAWKLNRSSDVR
jgi:TrmH family RNA methyltransferase